MEYLHFLSPLLMYQFTCLTVHQQIYKEEISSVTSSTDMSVTV